ncbi:MAG: hypothetical protein QGG53_29920, partial [Planctomycetota bacterium]|nr:hypothetical protein [Planctomycetota bacterium]
AGIMMSERMADFAAALGLDAAATRYRKRAAKAKRLVRKELWEDRLGRFIYWIDEDGVKHVDSQYHTYSWPVCFEITDLLDSYTSLRHLKETLISPRDIVYNSNQFPDDHLSCLGAPESIVVTGSAAVAFGRMGDVETCFRIMQGASKCIMTKPHEGCVPEQAQIDFQSYFCSAAGNFVWGVAEGLFGIRWDVPNGELKLEPCLPFSWADASIRLDNIVWRIKHKANVWQGTIQTNQPVKRKVKVRLPPCRVVACTVNGLPAKYVVEPGINGPFVTVGTAAELETRIEIEYSPANVHVQYEPDVAAGELLTARYSGCQVLEVIDRSGVTRESKISRSTVKMRLKENTSGLTPTVFLKCRCRTADFYFPLDLRIHQKFEIAPAGDARQTKGGYAVGIGVTNWAQKPVSSTAKLRILDKEVERTLKAKKSLHRELSMSLNKALLEKLSPGKNAGSLTLPGTGEYNFTFNLRQPYVDDRKLRDALASRLERVDLTDHYSHTFEQFLALREKWFLDCMDAAPDRPAALFLAEILGDQSEITDPATGLVFQIGGRNVMPAAHGLKVRIPLQGKAEKIYVLTVSCLAVEDTYSQVGEIGVNYRQGGSEKVKLTLPGNINWGYYYRGWETSLRWYHGLAIVYPGTVLDILEVPTDPSRPMTELYVAACGRRPVIGVLGVTILNAHSRSGEGCG